MTETNGILLDADIISHFIAASRQSLLREVFNGHYLMLVDQVYAESVHCPWDSSRKGIVDRWIEECGIIRIAFPSDLSSNVVDEYFRLKAEQPRLGKGERACMSIARFHRDIIASSNFRDVAPYCSLHGIEYLGMLDVLWIALHKGLIEEAEANCIIELSIRMDNARFPVSLIEQYSPDRDLSGWL